MEEKLSSAVVLVAAELVSKRGRNTVIASRFSAAFDCTETSDRNATLILAESAWSYNCYAADIAVNRSFTIYQQKGCRANFDASLKNDFAVKVALVVHWDG